MSATLEERLSRLEAANRRLRAGAFLVVLVGAVALGVGTSDAKPERAPTLKVERLEVVDADGRALGVFGIDENGGASLSVAKALDGPKAVLSVTKSGTPGLALRNAAGKAQLIASLGESGPALVLCDPKGDTLASLTSRNQDGTTLLGMKLPGEERHRAILTVMKDGQPYLRLRGPDGDLKVKAQPELEFSDVETK
jgi:hypothetical protein